MGGIGSQNSNELKIGKFGGKSKKAIGHIGVGSKFSAKHLDLVFQLDSLSF